MLPPVMSALKHTNYGAHEAEQNMTVFRKKDQISMNAALAIVFGLLDRQT